MFDVVLSVGSNCDDRTANVADAIRWLTEILHSASHSSIYETPELYGRGAPYMNAVVAGATDMAAPELDIRLKLYERTHGRDDEARNKGKVPVDIDIVVFDGDVIRPLDYSQRFFQIGATQLNLVV